MERDEAIKNIHRIFESNEIYADGGTVSLIDHGLLPPPALCSYQMIFTFAKTATNHCLSLKRIIDELDKIGKLKHFEYFGLKAPTENNQRTPQLRFNVTIDGSNYEIIFELP